MFQSYKIVAVIPAGRRMFLSHLLNMLLKQELIDEIHIWLNTKITEDVNFIKNFDNNKVNVIYPKIKVNGIRSIHHFFNYCIDENTIYIRFDDDICFIDKNAIERLLKFRVENPDFLLVYPNIVNNSMNSFRKHPLFMNNKNSDWYHSKISVINRHNYFLNNITNMEIFHCRNYEFDNFQVNINSICWFGKDFKKFDVRVGVEEERYLSMVLPLKLNKKNAICGNSIVSHYAFRTQIDFLKTTNIFNKYRNICKKLFI